MSEVNLIVLHKTDDGWQVHQAARFPSTEDAEKLYGPDGFHADVEHLIFEIVEGPDGVSIRPR